MTVTIAPEVVPFVESGAFASPESLVGEALKLLREQRLQLRELKDEIAIGIDQANRGEAVPFDADKIIANARKRFVDDTQPPQSDEWAAEIQKRSAEFDAGYVKTVSWDQVKAEALSRLEEN